MRRMDSQLEFGHLVDKTREYALKGPDRFKEKLAKMISDEPDADPREIASRIIDGVRYTFQFPDEVYCAGVFEACDSLTSAGFEMYERKNAWADDGDLIDESLRRDLTWGDTTAIAEWDRGEELTRDLVEISEAEAEALIERFREKWGAEG